MKVTKQTILDRINRMQTNFRVKWEDVVIDLDLAIEEINHWMGTKYPPVSQVIDDFAAPDKTYSYRASGIDVPYFPEKYFFSIVIPYAVAQLLAYDEEFSAIYSKYKQDVDDNLLKMVAAELHHVPQFLIDSPKGVYFQNPDPLFKQNPEAFFNRKIQVDAPRIKVTYKWNVATEYLQIGFVDKALPVDNNSYEKGSQYMPSIMGGNNYIPYLVDDKGTVVGIFVGWSLDKNSKDTLPTGYITLNEDITLYGVWNYELIRFRYNGNGGTLSNWQPMYINKEMYINDPQPVIPKAGTAHRLGYSFLGFDPMSFNEDLGELTYDNILDDGIIDEDELEYIQNIDEESTFEFTAQWAKIFYEVNFRGLEIESFEFVEQIAYTFGNEVMLPIPVERPGGKYVFLGWYDNQEFLGSSIDRIYEHEYGNKTFYARTDTNRYSVLIYNENDMLKFNQTYTYGTDLTKLVDLFKAESLDGIFLANENNEAIITKGLLLFRKKFFYFKIRNSYEFMPDTLRNNLILEPYFINVPLMTNIKCNYTENGGVENSYTFSSQLKLEITKQFLDKQIENNKKRYESNGSYYVLEKYKYEDKEITENYVIPLDETAEGKTTEIDLVYEEASIFISYEISSGTTIELGFGKTVTPEEITNSFYEYAPKKITIENEDMYFDRFVFTDDSELTELNFSNESPNNNEYEIKALYTEEPTGEYTNEYTLKIYAENNDKSISVNFEETFMYGSSIDLEDITNNLSTLEYVLDDNFYLDYSKNNKLSGYNKNFIIKNNIELFVEIFNEERIKVIFRDSSNREIQEFTKIIYRTDLIVDQNEVLIPLNKMPLPPDQHKSGYRFDNWFFQGHFIDGKYLNISYFSNLGSLTSKGNEELRTINAIPTFKQNEGFKLNFNVDGIYSDLSILNNVSWNETLNSTYGNQNFVLTNTNFIMNKIDQELNLLVLPDNKKANDFLEIESLYFKIKNITHNFDKEEVASGVVITLPESSQILTEINININLKLKTSYFLLGFGVVHEDYGWPFKTPENEMGNKIIILKGARVENLGIILRDNWSDNYDFYVRNAQEYGIGTISEYAPDLEIEVRKVWTTIGGSQRPEGLAIDPNLIGESCSVYNEIRSYQVGSQAYMNVKCLPKED